MKPKQPPRKSERQQAREMVLAALHREVAERQRIVGMHDKGSPCHVYRATILRLWRVALRAVEGAK